MSRSTIIALVAAGLLLAGCGGSGPSTENLGTPAQQDTAATPTTSEPASAMPEATMTGETAESAEPAPPVPEQLDFTAATIDGGTFDGASLAGKDALLWFWAPWCPVCRREAPVVAELARDYAGEVDVVGIAGLSSDLGAMQEFVADGGVDSVLHIDDRDGTVYARFGVTSQYDIGVVSDSGEVRIVNGPLSADDLRAEVEALAAG